MIPSRDIAGGWLIVSMVGIPGPLLPFFDHRIPSAWLCPVITAQRMPDVLHGEGSPCPHYPGLERFSSTLNGEHQEVPAISGGFLPHAIANANPPMATYRLP